MTVGIGLLRQVNKIRKGLPILTTNRAQSRSPSRLRASPSRVYGYEVEPSRDFIHFLGLKVRTFQFRPRLVGSLHSDPGLETKMLLHSSVLRLAGFSEREGQRCSKTA